jgi:hypothetical protein
MFVRQVEVYFCEKLIVSTAFNHGYLWFVAVYFCEKLIVSTANLVSFEKNCNFARILI